MFISSREISIYFLTKHRDDNNKEETQECEIEDMRRKEDGERRRVE